MLTKSQMDEAIAFLELFDQNDLSKLTYKNNKVGITIALKNPNEEKILQNVSFDKTAGIEAAASLKTSESDMEQAPQAEVPAVSPYEKILSPMTGAFYRKPKPDSEYFVQDGSFVEPTTTVCLLEAMKMFTEVKAGIKGKIVKILPADNSFVAEGDVLFEIQPM